MSIGRFAPTYGLPTLDYVVFDVILFHEFLNSQSDIWDILCYVPKPALYCI